MMEYKMPPLPEDIEQEIYARTRYFTADIVGKAIADMMRQYAEQAVAPLLAEIERLETENKRLQDMIFNSW